MVFVQFFWIWLIFPIRYLIRITGEKIIYFSQIVSCGTENFLQKLFMLVSIKHQHTIKKKKQKQQNFENFATKPHDNFNLKRLYISIYNNYFRIGIFDPP